MSTASTSAVRLWLRDETRGTECRAPITPDDAGRLIEQGSELTVEESSHRAFPVAGYAAAGCAIAPAGSWVSAPRDHYIVGLKELPDEPAALRHRHIFFAHAYKGQQGATRLLRRFAAGGGTLLDIEYLTDDVGRRLAAFGYWAGYVGAGLGVLHLWGRLDTPLRPGSKNELDTLLRQSPDRVTRALVIGAAGRCGHGARAALATAGITPTCWGIEETRVIDLPALLGHDLLVNTVLSGGPARPFLTRADLRRPGRRLTIISDVSCDVTSDCNVLPLYDAVTSWQRPVHRIGGSAPPVDVIAIDNLPALLPVQASAAFSAQLVPLLTSLGSATPAWQRCLEAFHLACRSAGIELETARA